MKEELLKVLFNYIYIRANPPGFSGRLLTTIYKQKTFTLRIDDQIIQKLNFNFSGVKLIQEKYNVGRYAKGSYTIFMRV